MDPTHLFELVIGMFMEEVAVLTLAPSRPCVAVPFSMISSDTRFASDDGIEKPTPIEPKPSSPFAKSKPNERSKTSASHRRGSVACSAKIKATRSFPTSRN